MPAKKLTEFLNSNNVQYESISHSTAYTAQEIAALSHTPGRDLAKTVIVNIDGDLAMAVLPASHMADLRLLTDATGAESVELASEQDFRERFPECATGAMPPFGNLYGMEVFVDESLTKDKEITFNAGSHNELVRIAFKDFDRLVEPTVVRFVRPVHDALAA
ncbi:MAG TPA: YbaK/EbsC family protein [Candidatus Angelobacter sp.]|nr:YbaK/EbsC family protein [Candidatus Angelobacter sp.]